MKSNIKKCVNSACEMIKELFDEKNIKDIQMSIDINNIKYVKEQAQAFPFVLREKYIAFNEK